MSRENREAGAALVLKSSMDEINKMIADEHPGATTMKPGADVPFNETAWKAGNRHAKSADLGGSSVAGKAASALE